MAQKIYPRSLRSNNQCAANLSFFSENNYAILWKKALNASTELLGFSEKNLLYKRKTKAFKKNKNKKYKYKTFYNTRFSLSSFGNSLKFSPVLFKFYKQSLSNKYNPIKAIYKVRRYSKFFKKGSFRPYKKKNSYFYFFFYFIFFLLYIQRKDG